MATLMQLVKGTQTVLPIAMIRYMDGRNVVESVRVTSFTGSKMKVVTSTVRASGITTRATPPDYLPQLAYIVQLAFYGVEPGTPASPISNVGVRCGCKSYYFVFSWPNMGNGCSFGTRFRPYVRKTDPSDPRYPPKNPSNIPGLCKHILLVASTLQNSDFYKESSPGPAPPPDTRATGPLRDRVIQRVTHALNIATSWLRGR